MNRRFAFYLIIPLVAFVTMIFGLNNSKNISNLMNVNVSNTESEIYDESKTYEKVLLDSNELASIYFNDQAITKEGLTIYGDDKTNYQFYSYYLDKTFEGEINTSLVIKTDQGISQDINVEYSAFLPHEFYELNNLKADDSNFEMQGKQSIATLSNLVPFISFENSQAISGDLNVVTSRANIFFNLFDKSTASNIYSDSVEMLVAYFNSKVSNGQIATSTLNEVKVDNNFEKDGNQTKITLTFQDIVNGSLVSDYGFIYDLSIVVEDDQNYGYVINQYADTIQTILNEGYYIYDSTTVGQLEDRIKDLTNASYLHIANSMQGNINDQTKVVDYVYQNGDLGDKATDFYLMSSQHSTVGIPVYLENKNILSDPKSLSVPSQASTDKSIEATRPMLTCLTYPDITKYCDSGVRGRAPNKSDQTYSLYLENFFAHGDDYLNICNSKEECEHWFETHYVKVVDNNPNNPQIRDYNTCPNGTANEGCIITFDQNGKATKPSARFSPTGVGSDEYYPDINLGSSSVQYEIYEIGNETVPQWSFQESYKMQSNVFTIVMKNPNLDLVMDREFAKAYDSGYFYEGGPVSSYLEFLKRNDYYVYEANRYLDAPISKGTGYSNNAGPYNDIVYEWHREDLGQCTNQCLIDPNVAVMPSAEDKFTIDINYVNRVDSLVKYSVDHEIELYSGFMTNSKTLVNIGPTLQEYENGQACLQKSFESSYQMGMWNASSTYDLMFDYFLKQDQNDCFGPSGWNFDDGQIHLNGGMSKIYLELYLPDGTRIYDFSQPVGNHKNETNYYLTYHFAPNKELLESHGQTFSMPKDAKLVLNKTNNIFTTEEDVLEQVNEYVNNYANAAFANTLADEDQSDDGISYFKLVEIIEPYIYKVAIPEALPYIKVELFEDSEGQVPINLEQMGHELLTNNSKVYFSFDYVGGLDESYYDNAPAPMEVVIFNSLAPNNISIDVASNVETLHDVMLNQMSVLAYSELSPGLQVGDPMSYSNDEYSYRWVYDQIKDNFKMIFTIDGIDYSKYLNKNSLVIYENNLGYPQEISDLDKTLEMDNYKISFNFETNGIYYDQINVDYGKPMEFSTYHIINIDLNSLSADIDDAIATMLEDPLVTYGDVYYVIHDFVAIKDGVDTNGGIINESDLDEYFYLQMRSYVYDGDSNRNVVSTYYDPIYGTRSQGELATIVDQNIVAFDFYFEKQEHSGKRVLANNKYGDSNSVFAWVSSAAPIPVIPPVETLGNRVGLWFILVPFFTFTLAGTIVALRVNSKSKPVNKITKD